MNNPNTSVLLIDDDKATNFFNSIMLTKHDFFQDVHAVQSGYDAITYLENTVKNGNTKPDLIFLDINMPGMNGWDFLTHFEKIDKHITKGIKIILLSTSSDPNEVRKSMIDYNVDDFICKPLSISLLDGVVEKHYELKVH